MNLAVGRVTDDEVVEDERSPLFPRKLDRVIIPLYSRRSLMRSVEPLYVAGMSLSRFIRFIR